MAHTYAGDSGSTKRSTVNRSKTNINGRKDCIVIRRDTHHCGQPLTQPSLWTPTAKMTIKQACEAYQFFSRRDDTEVKIVSCKEWSDIQAKQINNHLN